MTGATALHTRAACDNCGEMPATREGPGGTVLCDGCGAVKPANDDTQGAYCARPLCSRCQSDPAFFRLKDGDLCSACFAISNSVASTPQDAKVTAAAPSALPRAAAVTPFSKEPDVLALLFCAPFRRSSDSSSCGGVDGHAESGKGARKGSTVDPFDSGTLNNEVGIKPGPQDSIRDSASASPPAIADASSKLATLGQDAVFSSADPSPASFIDLEFDALVSGLEVRWALERQNSNSFRVVAASEMAPKSGSENPTPST